MTYKEMVATLKANGYTGPTSYTKAKLTKIYDAQALHAKLKEQKAHPDVKATGGLVDWSKVQSATHTPAAHKITKPSAKMSATELKASLKAHGYTGPTSYGKVKLAQIHDAHVHGVGTMPPTGHGHSKAVTGTKLSSSHAMQVWMDSNGKTHPNWTYEHQNAYSSYKASGHSYINKSLRQGAPSTEAKLMREVHAMKAVPLPAPKTLYRGVELSDTSHLKPGAIVTEKGFTSTAYEKSGAFGGNVQYKFTAPAGTPVLAGVKGEREFILDAGTKYQVTLVVPKTSYYGGTSYEVHATIIP